MRSSYGVSHDSASVLSSSGIFSSSHSNIITFGIIALRSTERHP
jgi:hypothetical protein